MRIAVIGTGRVGRHLASVFAERGHQVVVGTRDPGETATREEYLALHAEHPDVALAGFAEAVSGADLVVNALGGKVALGVLGQLGSALEGVVILDLSNPLDFSNGYPPSLFVKDDDSLGEQIQRAVPTAKVVKSLNTLNCALMADPDPQLGEPSTVFVSSDHADAKAVVLGLLGELGHHGVIDLGDLSTCRGTEMWLPLFMRISGALDTVEFNLRIVGPRIKE